MGTCKVRNEIETKRNELKRNEICRNETKSTETKRNLPKRNETKTKRNEIKTKPAETKRNKPFRMIIWSMFTSYEIHIVQAPQAIVSLQVPT